MKISSATRKALEKLASSVVESEESQELRGPLRAGRLNSLDAQDPDSWLFISADSLGLYNNALEQLGREPHLSHISARELDSALWRFVADLFAAKQRHQSVDDVTHRLEQLLVDLSRPRHKFEVICDIQHLDVTAEVRVAEMSISRLASDVAKLFTFGEAHLDDNGISRFLGQTVALVTVTAGDGTKAAELGKSQISEGLNVLRAAVATDPGPWPDVQLLFRRGRHTWVRKVEEPRLSYQGSELGFNPVPAPLRDLAPSTKAFLDGHQTALQDTSTDLSERVHRAIHWIASSITSESYDDKIVELCTALESFLTVRSDRRKGEAVAIRGLLLSIRGGQALVSPYILYDLYEKRSDIVHGSDRNLASAADYRWLRIVALQLVQSLMDLSHGRTEAGINEIFEDLQAAESLQRARELINAEQLPDRKGLLKARKDLLKWIDGLAGAHSTDRKIEQG